LSWKKGRNCMKCYFYNPEIHACALGEWHEWKNKECDEHFEDWNLLLRVYPWDSRLREHFPESLIEKKIKELEGESC